jgi:hypothetical protein
LAGRSGPFAPPELLGLAATTNPSVPVPRVGTLPFSGAATFRVSLGIAAQVPTFRTRACHRDRAASIPVAARPVGRLPPGLVPKEGRAFGFDNIWNGFRHVIGGSLTFAFPIHT